MKRAAFSMLELVFVVVAMAILGVALLPSNDRNEIGEAAHNIARHIRLAQHYAMMEDVYSADPAWRAAMWRIAFRTANYCYVVYANYNYASGGTQADVDECAIDPLSGRRMYSNTACSANQGYNEELLLWKQYGVNNITLTGCGSNKQILFDHEGRPYGSVSLAGDAIPLANDCQVKVKTMDGEEATITVAKETGFVSVSF